MGFLANAALRAQFKSRALVLTEMKAIAPNLDAGPVITGCHILPGERHHGIYIRMHEQTLAVWWCQNQIWAHNIDASSLDHALRSDTDLVSDFAIKHLTLHEPFQFGRIGHPSIMAGQIFAGATYLGSQKDS